LLPYLLTAAALFCIGMAAIITRRNAVVVLMGIELMLNAANLNLVAFSRYDPGRLQGQVFALFVIVVAAAEAAVALAILLRVFAHFNTVELDQGEWPERVNRHPPSGCLCVPVLLFTRLYYVGYRGGPRRSEIAYLCGRLHNWMDFCEATPNETPRPIYSQEISLGVPLRGGGADCHHRGD
jgi:NADH-quinone oxidoreductase subunit K